MTIVIGIDCATQPKRTGLVYARARPGGAAVLRAAVGSRQNPPAQQIKRWLAREPVALHALDAPLGWPQPLGLALTHHRAGQPIAGPPDRLFRRMTDDEIFARLEKRPLDVGADRIARTVHAALALLEELGRLPGQPIPPLADVGASA